MFRELMPLLRKRRLLLSISLVEGETIRATVAPQKATETEDTAIATPLAITPGWRWPAPEFMGPTCSSGKEGPSLPPCCRAGSIAKPKCLRRGIHDEEVVYPAVCCRRCFV